MNQSWLRALLENGDSESAILDFKRAVPTKDDAGIKSFLKDVAAFANARGGRIVYGVGEDGQGRAKSIHRIEGNVDQIAMWMQSKVLGGVFPRIHGIVVQPIHLGDDAVITVEVPVQYGGPYQVEVGDWRAFPARAGVRNTEMSYQQLFDAFSLRASAESRADGWIAGRTAELSEELRGTGMHRALVHMVPLSAFHAGDRPDLAVIREHHLRLSGSVLINRFNYRGMMASLSGSGSQPAPPYFQFYRNGIVEICWSVSVNNGRDNTLQSIDTAIKLMDLIPQAARAVRLAGVVGPSVLAMSYMNARGQSLFISQNDGQQFNSQPSDEQDLSFGPVMYESMDLSIEELGPIVRNLMTDLFRSFAMDDCFYFGSDGAIKSRAVREHVLRYRATWDLFPN